MQSVIVCCGTDGRCVVFGECETEPVVGEPITLHNARMIIYWSSECGGLFGLSQSGPKGACRISCAVKKTATEAVRQWLTVSDEAAKLLRECSAFNE